MDTKQHYFELKKAGYYKTIIISIYSEYGRYVTVLLLSKSQV